MRLKKRIAELEKQVGYLGACCNMTNIALWRHLKETKSDYDLQCYVDFETGRKWYFE